MKRSTQWVVAVPVLMLIGIATGVWLTRQFHVDQYFTHKKSQAADLSEADDEKGKPATASGDESESEKESKPVASVRAVKAGIGEITRKTDVYGSVISQPGAAILIQLGSEVVIKRVMIQSGEQVNANDPVCAIELSPSITAQLELARADLDSTNKLLQAAQEKQSMNLGTRQDLLQAQAAQHAAQLKLAQLQANLPDPSGIIRAPVNGRMTEVKVQSGAVIAAGAPLAEILANDAMVVQLGVLPSDAARLSIGQAILLHPVDVAETQGLKGTVRFISAMVDPASRLMNVMFDPPAGVIMRLGEGIRGILELKSENVLIIPRSAVLPQEDQHVVFTVHDGHAQRHVVQIGLQSPEMVEITGGDLKPGDEVITLGNYELTDGMAVRVENGK